MEKEIFLWLRLSVGPMFYGSFTALRGSLEPSDKKDTQDTGNTKHWDTLHSGIRQIYVKDAICWLCRQKGTQMDKSHLELCRKDDIT